MSKRVDGGKYEEIEIEDPLKTPAARLIRTVGRMTGVTSAKLLQTTEVVGSAKKEQGLECTNLATTILRYFDGDLDANTRVASTRERNDKHKAILGARVFAEFSEEQMSDMKDYFALTNVDNATDAQKAAVSALESKIQKVIAEAEKERDARERVNAKKHLQKKKPEKKPLGSKEDSVREI